MDPFEFHAPTKLVFAKDARKRVGQICSQFGRKVLLVTGKGSMRSLGFLDEMISVCQAAGCQVYLFDEVEPNPSVDTVDRGSEQVRTQDIEVILALGGGSAMDAAKAMGMVGKHGGGVWEYMKRVREVPGPILPLITITSTSGSGSHVTPFTVVINPMTHEKPGIGSPYLFPLVSLIDVEILRHQPAPVTAVTGVDVLTHAMESLFSRFASPMSDQCAWEAIRLVGLHLRAAVSNGDNLEARHQMSLADTYAGCAISNGGVTLGHALAHPVSGRFPEIAHGQALACVHVPFLRFMNQDCDEICRRIADMICPGTDDASLAFKTLMEEIGINPSLRRVSNGNLTEEMIEALVDNAMNTMTIPIQRSRTKVDKETLIELYRQAL